MSKSDLIAEGASLLRHLSGLQSFICSPEFNELSLEQKKLAQSQEEFMRNYHEVLKLRIGSLPEEIYLPFSEILHYLSTGSSIKRRGMKGFVCCQIPTTIEGLIIQKMQSLPVSAKKLLMDADAKIEYHDQCLYIEDGRATHWTPSVEDIFAKDWIVLS